MSGIIETKKKIMTSLKAKPKTLTDLSNELNLSLPTVKEHLEDLIKAGAIKEIEPHGKWRYYKIDPNFKIEDYSTPRLSAGKKLFIGIIIIVIATGYLLLYLSQKPKPTTFCITNSTYLCTNSNISNSGTVRLNLSGFKQKTVINNLGCSYNSSTPTNFTKVNIIGNPKQSVNLNLKCPSASNLIHVYVSYSTNGTNKTIILNVFRATNTTTSSTSTTTSIPVSHPTSSISTSISISTISSTILITTTQNSTTTASTTSINTSSSTISILTSTSTSSTITSTTSTSTTSTGTSTSSTSTSSATSTSSSTSTTSTSTSTSASTSTSTSISTVYSTTSTTSTSTSTSTSASTSTSTSTSSSTSTSTSTMSTSISTSTSTIIQYYLAINTIPTTDGVTTPSSGVYRYTKNSLVTIIASPTGNHIFLGWTGYGSGSYSGSNSIANITMNGNLSETAQFN